VTNENSELKSRNSLTDLKLKRKCVDISKKIFKKLKNGFDFQQMHKYARENARI